MPVTGKSFGRYTNLGGQPNWYQQDFTPGVNDRINFSVQRALPGKIVADVTFFMNFGRDLPYAYNLNQVDPRIGYANGNAVNANVANPFFNKLPLDKMPGQFRTQANVSVRELLRPYPQYQDMFERLSAGAKNNYKALQMQFQRPFINGFNFVVGYNYNRERNLEFYDEQDNFLRNFTWQPARNARHRITGAAIYELPFGKGRKYMSGSNAGGRRYSRRLVGERTVHLQQRSVSAFRHFAGERRSERGRANPGAVVQHVGVRGAARVHAAYEPPSVRRFEGTALRELRHDARQGVFDSAGKPVEVRTARRGV